MDRRKIKELNGKANLFDDLDGLNFEAISSLNQMLS